MSQRWHVDVLLEGSPYSSTCTLLTSGAERVLVDTGLSLQEDQLAKALALRGLRPGDITTVINTHLHVDHCGNNLLFESAAIIMSEDEWQWTRTFYAAMFGGTRKPELVVPQFYPEIAAHGLSPRTIRNVARMAKLFWDEKRLGAERQFRSATLPWPPGLERISTPGHTPHHLSVLVSSDEPVIVAGDAVLAASADAKIKTMIPYSQAEFAATRAALIARGHRIVPGHGPAFVPGARVAVF